MEAVRGTKRPIERNYDKCDGCRQKRIKVGAQQATHGHLVARFDDNPSACQRTAIFPKGSDALPARKGMSRADPISVQLLGRRSPAALSSMAASNQHIAHLSLQSRQTCLLSRDIQNRQTRRINMIALLLQGGQGRVSSDPFRVQTASRVRQRH